MCMFCAAIPVAGAVGAKLNAEQKRAKAHPNPARIEFESETRPEKPVAAITGGVIALLVIGSVVYHTSLFGRV